MEHLTSKEYVQKYAQEKQTLNWSTERGARKKK